MTASTSFVNVSDIARSASAAAKNISCTFWRGSTGVVGAAGGSSLSAGISTAPATTFERASTIYKPTDIVMRQAFGRLSEDGSQETASARDGFPSLRSFGRVRGR